MPPSKNSSLLALAVLTALAQHPILSAAELELEKPQNHGGFFSFAFSPDGRYVAGGTGKVTFDDGKVVGGEIIVWSAKSGKILKQMGGGQTIEWVQFSSNGKYIACATNDKPTAMIWSVSKKTRRPKSIKLEGPYPWTAPPIISPDGKNLIAVASEEKEFGDQKIKVNGKLSVWTVSSRKVKWAIENSSVKTMALSPDGKTLAGYVNEVQWAVDKKSGQLRGKHVKTGITLWDMKKGKVIGDIDDAQSVDRMAFLPDGKTLAGANRNHLVLWDIKTLEQRNEIKIESKNVPISLIFAKNGSRAAIPRHMGRTVDIWDMKRNKLSLQLKEKFPTTYGNSAFSPKLDRMACKHGHEPVIIDLK